VRAERADSKALSKEFDKTEDDLKAVQNAGQIIAEVLKQLDEDRCQMAHIATLCPLCCCWLAHAFRCGAL